MSSLVLSLCAPAKCAIPRHGSGSRYNYAEFYLAGAFVLFMLLSMRGRVLILSPIVDVVCGRKIHAYSLVALGCLAAAVSLTDIDSYRLPVLGVLGLGAYLAGYAGRFRIIRAIARTVVLEVDRRYFVAKPAMATAWQVVLCADGTVLAVRKRPVEQLL